MRVLSLFKAIIKKKIRSSEADTKKSTVRGKYYNTGIEKSFDSLVLIGTVKSQEQFNVCISEKMYYIPLRHLKEDGVNIKTLLHKIKHVSVYQSIKLFGDDSGIKYIGEVEKAEIVRRYEITSIPKQSKEYYVKFTISNWQEKEQKIRVAEIGVYPFVIVPFGSFKTATETAELTITSPLERELYRRLKELACDVNKKSFELDGFTYIDENDTLVILRENQCYLQLPMEVIRELPHSGFETVKESIK